MLFRLPGILVEVNLNTHAYYKTDSTSLKFI